MQKSGQESQRLFTLFQYYAGKWSTSGLAIVKCEANLQGTNRRAVLTNRPAALVLPDAAYDGYTDRGESENRNKEIKCGPAGDRLGDHSYMANRFRLHLYAAAHNLLVRLRQTVAIRPNRFLRPKFPSKCFQGTTGNAMKTIDAGRILLVKASRARGEPV